MTDVDIIDKLVVINAQMGKKPTRILAGEIDKILQNNFEETNKKYTEKINLLKDAIVGIRNNCHTKYTKRVLATDEIITQLGLKNNV